MSSPPPEPTDTVDYEPVQQHGTQRKVRFPFLKRLQPVWFTQMPFKNIPNKPDESFQLINDDMIQEMKDVYQLDAQSIAQIKADRAFMETELMRYFRELDVEAKVKQNEYRKHQIRILILASAATLTGAMQAISINNEPYLRFFGFLEAVIALFTVFVIQIRSSDATLPGWLGARKKAEQLRREYFRFMLRLPPYDQEQPIYKLRLTLSARVAEIYNDKDPEEPSILEGDAS